MAGNVDIIKSGYDNFAKGDIPAVLAILDPNVRWTEPAGLPYPGTFVGHAEVVDKVFKQVAGDWDDFEIAPDEFIDAGDTVIAVGEVKGTAKATGKKLKAAYAHIWRLRDGVVVSFVEYVDTALAREALGK